MQLINCKIHRPLNWTKDCVISDIAGETTFKITNTKIYVPIVTLSNKDSVNLTKQLNEGYKRPVYWYEYKSKIESRDFNDQNPVKFYLDASFEGVKRFFALAFNNTTEDVVNNPVSNTNNIVLRNSHRNYFLPRVNITSYNVPIDGRSFYDQLVNDQIKKYDEIRKITTGFGDDCTTGCSLDYQCFRDHYQLIAVDLPKQKELDADLRAIQQIEFYRILKTKSQVCIV